MNPYENIDWMLNDESIKPQTSTKDKKNSKRCSHDKVRLLETIEATTAIEIIDGKVFSNNEYGNLIRTELECLSCEKKWTVDYKLPKHLKSRFEEINRSRNSTDKG